jgi:hypothetical protein
MTEQYEDIKEILEWTDERVYLIMAITRQKENEEITANTRKIHRSIVREESGLEDTIEHLKQITKGDGLKYRLYISVNGRSVIDGVFNLKDKLDSNIKSMVQGDENIVKTFKKVDSEYKSILQKPECRDERRFMFDLDNTSQEDVKRFKETIDTEVILTKESPNGHHIVTEPFHYQSSFDDIDVEKKKDAMIFMGYI